MLSEYIERKLLLEKRWDVPFETEDAHFVQVVDVGDILNAPTADVAPVRHGKWIDLVSEDEKRWKWDCIMKCSECGEMYTDDRFKFCPNCGAKMDKEES